jgi:hypothetical protein
MEKKKYILIREIEGRKMKRFIYLIFFLMIFPMISCEDADITIPEDLIIQIDANPRKVEPDTSEYIEGWGKTTITARVLNSSLEPIEGIGVILSADPAGVFQSNWESIGDPIQSDSNGRVSDILHTDAATVVTAFTGEHTADINIGFGLAGAAPEAILFAEPNPAKAGTSVVFDASGSFDNDGGIVNYHWEITPDIDPPEVLEGGDLLILIRRYNVQQNVDVILTVTDNSGDTDIDTTIEEIVNNLPPIAHAGPDQTIPFQPVETMVILDHSQSVDPDGQIVRIRWDCDNGTYYDVPTGQPFGECIYTNSGDYYPEVTVWDDGNGEPGYPDQKSDVDSARIAIET